MEKVYEKVTFRPISGGRLRCNQTGARVSRIKAEGYRRRLLNAGRPKTYTFARKVDKYSTISCPVCHTSIRVSDYSGVYECYNSHKVNVTVKQYYWET